MCLDISSHQLLAFAEPCAGHMEPLHRTLLFRLRDGSGKGAVKLDSSLLVF